MRTRFAALLALAGVICQAQTITTIAGTPNCCVTADGTPATSTWLAGLGPSPAIRKAIRISIQARKSR